MNFTNKSKQNLYIHVENQQLLWNTINKYGLFHLLYKDENEKKMWFKNTIASIYEKYGQNIYDVESLQKINKETTVYMIKYLKEMKSKSYTPDEITAQNTAQNKNLTYMGKQEEQAYKQDLYNKAFGEKQKEYENMFLKQTPPDVKFTENINDEPITNMEELLKKHQLEREKELNMFPAPVTPINTMDNLKIQNTIEKEKNRKVNFSDKADIYSINNENTEESIIEIKNTLHDLVNKYNNIIEELKLLREITGISSIKKEIIE